MWKSIFSTYTQFLQDHAFIGSRFVFWIKSSIALILASFLAFEFETPEAGWAVICAAILIHPDSGAVLAKSIARIIGTVIGALVAIILFFFFPQAPWIFLLFLALWVGACSYYSSYTKDFKTYAVALSGFMPAIIFMTAIENSTIDEVMRIATLRAATISLGILCVAIVFGLTHIRKGYQGFIHDIYQINPFIQNIFSKASPDNIDDIRQFTSFMEGFKRRLNYAAAEDPEVANRANPILTLLNDVFGATIDLNNYLTVANENHWISPQDQQHITFFLNLLQSKNIISDLELFLENPRIQEVSLLRRTMLLAKFLLYLQKEFTQEPLSIIPRKVGVFVDHWLTQRMSFGAFIVVLIASIIWILSEWPLGPFFITFTASAYLLQANKDNYGKEAVQFFLGAVLSIIPAFIAQQIFMPITYGFVWFSFWLSLAILAPALCKASQKYATLGAGFVLFTTILIFPSNTMNYDFQNFLNTYFAACASCGLAMTAIILLMPWNPKQRIQRLLFIGKVTVSELPFLSDIQGDVSSRLDTEQDRYSLLVRFYNSGIYPKNNNIDIQFLTVISLIRIFQVDYQTINTLKKYFPQVISDISLLWKNIEYLNPTDCQNLIDKFQILRTHTFSNPHEFYFFTETLRKLLLNSPHA